MVVVMAQLTDPSVVGWGGAKYPTCMYIVTKSLLIFYLIFYLIHQTKLIYYHRYSKSMTFLEIVYQYFAIDTWTAWPPTSQHSSI